MSNVLVVEDNVNLSRFYVKVLGHAGITAKQAFNCKQAIEHLEHDVPELILLDMSLPDGSGTVILNYLAEHEAYRGTRVVVVSGDNRYGRQVLVQGVKAYLDKPVSSPALVECVKGLLVPHVA